MPKIAAMRKITAQITFEAKRFFPLSKMYGKPCRDVDWLYSIVVSFTTPF